MRGSRAGGRFGTESSNGATLGGNRKTIKLDVPGSKNNDAGLANGGPTRVRVYIYVYIYIYINTKYKIDKVYTIGIWRYNKYKRISFL